MARDRVRGPHDELGPALSAGRDRELGSLSQSGTPRVSTTSSHVMPSASPGCSSHRSQRWRTGPGRPARGRRRRAAAPPSPWHGAAPRSRAPWRRAARRSRTGGRPARRPGAGRGRSARCSPGPPDTRLRLHSASPWRTSTIRVEPSSGGKMRRTPSCERSPGSDSARLRLLAGSLTPGCRRTAPAGAASGTRRRRRSGRRTRPRWSRPSPSSHAARGSASRRGGPGPAGPRRTHDCEAW